MKKDKQYPVVDLFAGSDGLGEGFSSLKGHKQQSFSRLALSIEKTEVAHRTLMLRAVFRRMRGTTDIGHYYRTMRSEINATTFRGIPAGHWSPIRWVALPNFKL